MVPEGKVKLKVLFPFQKATKSQGEDKRIHCKAISPIFQTKLDRKSRVAGQALGLQVAWKLEFGATHVFGGKSAGLRARSPEFWIGSHVVM